MTQIKSSTNTTTWQRYILRIHVVYCILIRGEFMGILLILKDFPLERCCGQKNLWNSEWKIWNFWALPKSDTLLGVKVLNWNKYVFEKLNLLFVEKYYYYLLFQRLYWLVNLWNFMLRTVRIMCRRCSVKNLFWKF